MEINVTNKETILVNETNTALAMGSGDMLVFATPAMIALMENAAASLVLPYLEDGHTTVGSSISVTHTSPTPIGIEVSASATLIEIDRKRLVFLVEAYDKMGIIGTGKHERFIVEMSKFQNKANEKFS